MPELAIYLRFAHVRMSDLLANRARFATGIFSYFIYVSVYAAIFRAIYASATDREVGGLDLGQALTYVAVAWIMRSLYTNTLDRDITNEVRQGNVALSLLRPIDYPLSKLAGAVGEVVTRGAIFTLPAALVVVLVYPVQPPASPLHALATLAAALLAFAIYSSINLLIGISAVFAEHTLGLQRAKNAMMDLFGGVLLPLSFYPAWAQDLLLLLPFQAVTYTPVSLYLGTLPILPSLLVQLVWLVLLLALVRLLWRQAVGRLTIHGG